MEDNKVSQGDGGSLERRCLKGTGLEQISVFGPNTRAGTGPLGKSPGIVTKNPGKGWQKGLIRKESREATAMYLTEQNSSWGPWTEAECGGWAWILLPATGKVVRRGWRYDGRSWIYWLNFSLWDLLFHHKR